MEILKKYPKSFQWLFLLIIFFGLCFAIDVPDGYKFIRSVAEYSKDPNLSSYNLFGIEVRYYGYDTLWRLPPLLGEPMSDNKNLSDLKVSKDAIIETVAEKILSQEKPVTVIDSNKKVIGIVKPSKVIHTVFGGRKEN